jgi:hypothetical protein
VQAQTGELLHPLERHCWCLSSHDDAALQLQVLQLRQFSHHARLHAAAIGRLFGPHDQLCEVLEL